MERTAVLTARRPRLNRKNAVIVMLYVLLLAGGLWHMLGLGQAQMRFLAAPMIVAIAVLLCVTHLRSLQGGSIFPNDSALTSPKTSAQNFLLWCVIVFAGGFLVECVGVRTDLLFGPYEYTHTLQPMLLRVPLAIGCAWLAMIISSAAIVQKFLPQRFQDSNVLFAGASAGFMVMFDIFMEPAAVKLGYWRWQNAIIPMRNYLAWFAFGFFLTYSGTRLRVFAPPIPQVAMHAYLAQLGYFILVMLS